MLSTYTRPVFLLSTTPTQLDMRWIGTERQVSFPASVHLGTDRRVIACGTAPSGVAASSIVDRHAPFAHPRIVIDDFDLATALVEHAFAAIRTLALVWKPHLIWQVIPGFSDPLTPVEWHVLRDLALNCQALDVAVWSGPALDDATISAATLAGRSLGGNRRGVDREAVSTVLLHSCCPTRSSRWRSRAMGTIATYDWEAADDRPQPHDTANDTAVFDQALAALAAFDQTFGRPLTPSFVAELHVARMLGLRLRGTPNAPGFDGWDAEQRRYEIKYRQPRNIIDINGFDFDVLVLVNLNARYQPSGIWTLDVATAQHIAVYREKFRKYQITQQHFKAKARPIVSTS